MRIDDLAAPLTIRAQKITAELQAGTKTLLYYRLKLSDDQIDLLHLFENHENVNPADVRYRIGWRFKLTINRGDFSTVDLIEWSFTREMHNQKPSTFTETVRPITAAELNASLRDGNEVRARVELGTSKIYYKHLEKKAKLQGSTAVKLFVLGGFSSVKNPHERPASISGPAQPKQHKPKKGHKRRGELKPLMVFTPAYINKFAETRNNSGTRWVDLPVGYDTPHPSEGPSQFRRFRN